MAISPAPKRKTEQQNPAQTDAKTERKILDVINRGGSTLSSTGSDQASVAVKNVNVSLTSDEIATIAELRERRPRDARSTRKTPISQHAWILEAVHNQIEREKKKYGLA